MIIDSSVLIAILRTEPEASRFRTAMAESDDTLRLSAASYLETAIVVDGSRNPVLSRELDHLVDDAGLVIEPVTETQARIAREAYRDFGKGSGHPAQLNFGDCFAYALAKDLGEPLLFKGDDFRHTDVRPAGG
ncbi:MAG: type II toxin-antitoxin system VapC family toxin [Alphaproteobacteria bacterium]|nr:type II toxin-antitoxin system VapC family toxin [Alphaproteobacteria bacterium]